MVDVNVKTKKVGEQEYIHSHDKTLSLDNSTTVESEPKQEGNDVDGDTLVTWPKGHRFWESGDYTPFDSRADMLAAHEKDLRRYIENHPHDRVYMNVGADFMSRFPDLPKAMVIVPEDTLKRNLASRLETQKAGAQKPGAQPTEFESTYENQQAMEAEARKIGIPVLKGFDAVKEHGISGLIVATSGAGKTTYVESKSKAKADKSPIDPTPKSVDQHFQHSLEAIVMASGSEKSTFVKKYPDIFIDATTTSIKSLEEQGTKKIFFVWSGDIVESLGLNYITLIPPLSVIERRVSALQAAAGDSGADIASKVDIARKNWRFNRKFADKVMTETELTETLVQIAQSWSPEKGVPVTKAKGRLTLADIELAPLDKDEVSSILSDEAHTIAKKTLGEEKFEQSTKPLVLRFGGRHQREKRVQKGVDGKFSEIEPGAQVDGKALVVTDRRPPVQPKKTKSKSEKNKDRRARRSVKRDENHPNLTTLKDKPRVLPSLPEAEK